MTNKATQSVLHEATEGNPVYRLIGGAANFSDAVAMPAVAVGLLTIGDLVNNKSNKNKGVVHRIESNPYYRLVSLAGNGTILLGGAPVYLTGLVVGAVAKSAVRKMR